MQFLVSKIAKETEEYEAYVCPLCGSGRDALFGWCLDCDETLEKVILTRKKGEEYTVEHDSYIIPDDGIAFIVAYVSSKNVVWRIKISFMISNDLKDKYNTGFYVKKIPKTTTAYLYPSNPTKDKILFLSELNLSLSVKKGELVKDVLSRFKEDKRIKKYMKKYNLKFS